MDQPSVISILGAVISAASAVVVVVMNRRAAVRDRQLAADEQASRYRIPLLHAAFNLQSRFYNIGRQDFLGLFLANGSPSEAQYARLNTAYLIGQYLCWAEILRRESQLVTPLHRVRERDIMIVIEKIRFAMADSLSNHDPVLRIFRGDQRAIGEVMLTTTSEPGDRAGPRWDCIGYAGFVQSLADEQPALTRWMKPLLGDIDQLAAGYAAHQARVASVQHGLVELVNLIDPEGSRIPATERERL